MKPLRPNGQTQGMVLLFVRDYMRVWGWSPTVREICLGVGISSTSTVHVHLANLERAGLIERGPGPRQVRVAA